MNERKLLLFSLLAIMFVVVTVVFFAYWPGGFLGISRPNSPGDFGQLFSAAQSIFAGLGLIGVVYTILRQHLDLQEQRKNLQEQQKTTQISLELATSTALFSYYNNKIASLRNAIKRDAKNKDPSELQDLLGTQSLEVNTQILHELLEKHKILRDRMEQLNRDLCPPNLEPESPKALNNS